MWAEMWRSPTFSDVQLVLDSGSDRLELPCHRLILAKASTYFSTRLLNSSYKDTLGYAASCPLRGTSSQPATPTGSAGTTVSSAAAAQRSSSSSATSRKCHRQDGTTTQQQQPQQPQQHQDAGDNAAGSSPLPPSTPDVQSRHCSEHGASPGTTTTTSTPPTITPPTSHVKPAAATAAAAAAVVLAAPASALPASPACPACCVAAPVINGSELVLIEHVSPQELPVALAVLEHAYTGRLPQDVHMLAQCCLKAEYWGMDGSLAACLGALGQQISQPQADPSLLGLLNKLPAHMLDTPAGTQLTDRLQQQVLTLFGDAVKVLRDGTLRHAFVSLPFPLLRHWAASDELRTDAENTIAVLLTLWVEHQRLKRHKLAAQLTQLSQLLRLQQLTLSFHFQAVPKMWWFRTPPGLPSNHALARMNLERSKQLPHDTARAAYHWNRPRRVDPQQGFTFEWQVPAADLQRLWAGEDGNNGGSNSSSSARGGGSSSSGGGSGSSGGAAPAGGEGDAAGSSSSSPRSSKLLDSATQYYAGYAWRFSLEFCKVEGSASARTLSMNIQVVFCDEWPALRGVKASLTARVRVEVSGAFQFHATEDLMGWDCQFLWGWYDILGQRISDFQRDLLRTYAPDGHLPLRITVTDLQ